MLNSCLGKLALATALATIIVVTVSCALIHMFPLNPTMISNLKLEPISSRQSFP